MTFPCKDCICVPSCANKDFNILFTDCAKLSRYLKNGIFVRKRSQWKLEKLNDTLQPTNWKLQKIKGKYAIVPTKKADMIKLNIKKHRIGID